MTIAAGDTVVVRVDGAGVWRGRVVSRVARVIRVRGAALTVRLKMGMARWSPVARVLESASVVRQATEREAELGLTS